MSSSQDYTTLVSEWTCPVCGKITKANEKGGSETLSILMALHFYYKPTCGKALQEREQQQRREEAKKDTLSFEDISRIVQEREKILQRAGITGFARIWFLNPFPDREKCGRVCPFGHVH